MRDSGGVEEESFPQLVSRVVDDAKEVARAEIDLVKAQVTAKLAAYRGAVVLFAVAALLTLVALGGLIVGLILTLAQYLGAGWATLIVIGATFALAALLGWLGWQRWKQA